MVNHCVVQLTLIILYMNYTSIKNKLKKKVKALPVWIFPGGTLPSPPSSFKPWPPGSWVWLYKHEWRPRKCRRDRAGGIKETEGGRKQTPER